MLLRSIRCFVVLYSLWILGAGSAQAQLGEFLSGSKVEIIDTKQLVKLLAEHQKTVQKNQDNNQPSPAAEFVLVDVRSEKEIAVSIIPGAITKADFEESQEKLRDKLIIPYCTVGGRSEKYAKQLIKDGWKVKNYKGSILEWVGSEQPLVTVDGKPTNRVHTYSDRYRIPAKYQQVTE